MQFSLIEDFNVTKTSRWGSLLSRHWVSIALPSLGLADVELELQLVQNIGAAGNWLWSVHHPKRDWGHVLKIHNIIKVLLTMPVSAALVEGSFSCLRCLKTHLRSSITETFALIIGLALWVLSIHNDFEVDMQRVLREFDATGTRRVNLSL